MKTDVLVLGAGMVGISAAMALQARGRSVVLADRRGAAEETSYGNAGLIQREGIVPYSFPRDLAKIIAALDEWEKGAESPGRALANMKTAGLARVLAQLAAEGWTPSE